MRQVRLPSRLKRALTCMQRRRASTNQGYGAVQYSDELRLHPGSNRDWRRWLVAANGGWRLAAGTCRTSPGMHGVGGKGVPIKALSLPDLHVQYNKVL